MSVFVRMLTASGIAFAALAAGPANAATLVEQELGTTSGAFGSYGDLKIFENFSLAARSSIESITFWGYPAENRDFEIGFWSAMTDGRFPDVTAGPLYTANVLSEGRPDAQGINVFAAQYEATFDKAVNLAAGHYFVSIYSPSYFSWIASSSMELGVHQTPTMAVINQKTGYNFYHEGNVAFRLDGEVVPAAAVPEPATWALMMAGFGLVGTAMRRRAVRASVA